PPPPERISAMSSPTADCAPSAGRRFGFKQCSVQVRKVLELQSRDFLADKMFDRLQGRQLLAVHEREGVADLLRTPSSSDPVNIILGVLWHIVIDDVTHACDIQSARCDISRHHELVFAALE